ncbi:MAG TPA: hypothetical protein DCX01_10515 [Bacteroidetes bacterium]|nr:hypothetical protein [Bacteroidota bacterium]
MNRNEELLKLRPKIKSIQQDLNTSDLEQFQNVKLRPILKLQHEILLALFQSSWSRNKVSFAELKAEEKRSKLDQLFQKNLSSKNQSIGAVIGMLTVDEYTVYTKDTSAHNRRIITMLKQRILSTFER